MTERGPVLVDTQAAAHAVGVKVSTIKNWTRRGDLVPVERGGVGRGGNRNMYRLRDVRIVHRNKTHRPVSVDTQDES